MAEGKLVVIGGWEVHDSNLDPSRAKWFSVVLTEQVAPWAFSKGLPFKVIAALELFAEMKRADIQPNVITYNAMISTCEKVKDLDAALEFFAGMKRADIQPDVQHLREGCGPSEGIGDL